MSFVVSKKSFCSSFFLEIKTICKREMQIVCRVQEGARRRTRPVASKASVGDIETDTNTHTCSYAHTHTQVQNVEGYCADYSKCNFHSYCLGCHSTRSFSSPPPNHLPRHSLRSSLPLREALLSPTRLIPLFLSPSFTPFITCSLSPLLPFPPSSLSFSRPPSFNRKCARTNLLQLHPRPSSPSPLPLIVC